MKFSPDNQKLAVVSDCNNVSGRLTVFDLAAGTNKSFPVSPDGIDLVTFSRDGSILAAVGFDGDGQLWKVDSGVAITPTVKVGVERLIGSPSSNNTCIALAPNDTTLVVGMSDGSLALWDMMRRRMIMSSHLSRSAVASVAFTNDARHFAAQFSDGSIRIWESRDRRSEYRVLSATFFPAGQFVFLPDNKHMLTLTSGTVRLWNLYAYEKVDELPDNEHLWRNDMRLGPRNEVFSPNGRALAVLATIRQMVALDVQTLLPIGPVVTFQGDVGDGIGKTSLCFSPDNTLVGYQNPRATWVVNVQTGEQWRVPDDPNPYGAAIAFSPDKSTFATANNSDDFGEIRLWDVRSHSQIGTSVKVPYFITALSFSPDGQHLLLGSSDSNAIMLSDLNRAVRQTLSIKDSGFLAILPDGKRILTTRGGSIENKESSQMQLWDVANQSPIGPAMKLDSVSIPNTVIFLGDGTRALVVEERSMEIWDLIANVKIGTPVELPNEKIDAAQLSADERHLMAVDTIGHVYFWDFGTALRLHGRALVNAVCQRVIPGKLSTLSATELNAAPFLDPQHDADTCGR